MKKSVPILVLVFLCCVFSCTKDVGTVNLGNYPDDIDNLITTYCSVQSCHNAASSGAANGLNLETWATMFEGSKSGSPVIPFSSRFSSLCYFINTYSDLGSVNFPTMPLDKTPLSREQVSLVKDWIDAGAPDRNGLIFGSDPELKKLYAVNQGCDVVTVINSKTKKPIRYLQVGPGHTTPHQVRVSPDGKFWYVIFLNSNVMKKFRCSDDAFVAEIPLTPLAAGTGSLNAVDWNTFVITSDSKRAYCVSWTAQGAIAAVNLEKNKLISFNPGGSFPHGIALSKDESKIYVAAQTGNYITEIDTAFINYNSYSLDNNAVQQISSLDPHDMLLSPDGNFLYVTCQKSNELRIFSIGLKTTIQTYATGFYPQEITYSAKFNTYYIACSGDGTTAKPGSLTKFTESAGVQTIPCGAQPHGLVADDNMGLLYVLSRNISSDGPLPHHSSQCTGRNGFVNFIDMKAFKITSDKFELSVDPYFISIRP